MKATKLKSKDLGQRMELLLARKTQIQAELAELEHESSKEVSRFHRLQEAASRNKKQLSHLSDNYSRLSGHLTKLEAELRGELVEINGLLRTLPIRRKKPTLRKKNVSKLIAKAGLKLKSDQVRKEFQGARGIELLGGEDMILGCTDCITACTECVTACTECVTSCNGDCISCSSDCVGACTSCSPSGVTGCIDTFGMQSLFDRKEKVFDPEALRALPKEELKPTEFEIDWE